MKKTVTKKHSLIAILTLTILFFITILYLSDQKVLITYQSNTDIINLNINNSTFHNNDLLIVNFVEDNHYNMSQQTHKTLTSKTAIFTYAIITIIILSIIVTSVLYYKKTKNNKLKYLEHFLSGYENILFILTDNKYNIIKINNIMKENFNETQILKIVKLFKADQNNNEINIYENNKTYKFKKLEYHNCILFLSENYTEIIIEQNKILYNNSFSNLPNYNSLEQYINSSSNKQKSSLILFSIKNVKNIFTANNITNYKLISAIKKQLNKDSNKDNKLLFHLKSDLFAILIKNRHIFEEQTKFIDDNLKELKTSLLKDINITFEFIVGVINIDRNLLNENILLRNIIDTVLNVAYKYDGNKTIFYDNDLKTELIASETIKKDLEKGIKNKEFVMYLQPIYNLDTNKVVKYEALLRWNNEKYINTSPLTYIKIAEEYKLIYELGYLVIEETTKLAAKIKDKDVTITINVSPKELGNLGFTNKLLLEISKNNILPTKIGIEITETSLIEATPNTIENINKIRSKGINIYLDDFGTGYSSLINLRDFPVDYIKIDRSFINNMESNIIDEKITASLIDLAHSLNLKVIAEGVETKEQSDKLKLMGCQLIQGYYFSKPLPFEELFKKN